MTDFPTTRRRVARTAFDTALKEWQARTRDALATLESDLIVTVAGDQAALAVVTRHTPSLSGYAVVCSVCYDPDDGLCHVPQCCGDVPGHVAFPCPPLAAAVAPYGVNPTDDLPRRPVWSEFYREPDVTITLAHHTSINGAQRRPRDEVTVPLSTARNLRVRMTPESWLNVERLAHQ